MRRAILLAVTGLGLLGPVAVARAAPSVFVFPIPGSRLATPQTQITFRGLPVASLGAIAVSGSRTGPHAGRLEGDSDGQGGSFLPDRPFAQGEVVTVHTGLDIVGGSHGTFTFTVERIAGHIPPPGQRHAAARVGGDVQSFRSEPGLHPAAVKIRQGSRKGQDIFITPIRGPVQWGPMIIDPAGRLVWFYPIAGPKEAAGDLQVQRYRGQPVLTWWHGYLNAGEGKGEDVIMNDHYQQIAKVSAGNGLKADIHEMTITPQNTALITAFQMVRWNAASVGGRRQGAIQDAVLQEIDIPTGLVLFQWDSLDHVPLKDSYLHITKRPRPLDYFHLNSIQEIGQNLFISARNTWAMYEIDHRTGKVIWELGGKHSSFTMGPGTRTAYQHDARLHPGGLLTVFDDGASPPVHPQSRGLVERLDLAHRRVTLVRELDHSPKLISAFEGSVQPLGHGHDFVGWGAQPYFTEYDGAGRQIYDGRFVDANSSYRAYRFPWDGQPLSPPALAIHAVGATAHLYASWNGATEVRSWRILAGSSPGTLSPVKTTKKRGFETALSVKGGQGYFAVQALGAGGRVLATSAPKPR